MSTSLSPENLPPGYHFDPQFGPVCPIYCGYDAELQEAVIVDMSNPEHVARYGTDREEIMTRLAPKPPIPPVVKVPRVDIGERLAQTLVDHTGETQTITSLLELAFPEQISEMYRTGDEQALQTRIFRTERTFSMYVPDRYMPETHAIQRGRIVATKGEKIRPFIKVMRAIVLDQTIETGEVREGFDTIRWRALNAGRQQQA